MRHINSFESLLTASRANVERAKLALSDLGTALSESTNPGGISAVFVLTQGKGERGLRAAVEQDVWMTILGSAEAAQGREMSWDETRRLLVQEALREILSASRSPFSRSTSLLQNALEDARRAAWGEVLTALGASGGAF